MIIRKKQIFFTVLVLILGATIFLNWKLTGDNKIKGVNSTISSGKQSQKANTSTSGTSYFATARLTREQAEAQAEELLNTAASGTALTSEEKQTVESEISYNTNLISSEKNIESLISAKGYECVVLINNGIVNVILHSKNEATLTSGDAQQVNDIVTKQTGVSADQIRIILYQ